MKEIVGNIWDFHKQGKFIAITTNGTIRKDGACVMGKGVAAECKSRYPELPYELGRKLKIAGNRPFLFEPGIVTFPVKHNWWEKADIKLIRKSAQFLQESAIRELYLVRPGCGNGGLDWEKEVKPVLEKILDDRFIVVNLEENP